MAQYRSIRSFPKITQFLEYLRDASPGQLRFTYDEIAKVDTKKEQPFYRFMSDSRSLQIRGEYKKELEEALYFYQQRGEPLKSEWDVMCAISVRMDSLMAFDHLGYESSRLAQIVRYALRYYTDPIAELTRIGRDYDWNLYKHFTDCPPTRRAVTASSHPSYTRVIEPLIPPHLGSNTYNRLTAINGGLDMEELWYTYLPMYLKEDIKNHPKETNEYLQSRARGDEKRIRELMLSGDYYTLNDHLYNNFWGKDDYEKDEKEFREANILNRDENYNLEMRMRVQSGMAKIAAELVPFILERNEYNAVMAVSELSSYLGEMADQALKGVERVVKLSPDTWGMKGNDIQPIITPEYGGAKLANPEKGQDMYERTIRMNSPAHGIINRKVQEARQSEREQQKKIREREGNARDAQIQALKESLAKLQKDLGALTKENEVLQKRSPLSTQEVLDMTQAASRSTQNEATSIAYAACADHLREKMTLHGEDVQYLKDFPSLKDTLDSLRERRDRYLKQTSEKLQAEGYPDPNAHLPIPADKQTSDFVAVKVVESMEKYAIAESAAMKSKCAPEIDQLRESQSESPHATEKAPVTAKDHAGNTETPDNEERPAEPKTGTSAPGQ